MDSPAPSPTPTPDNRRTAPLPASPSPRRGGALAWLLVLCLLALLGAIAYAWYSGRLPLRADANETVQRVDALEQRVDHLRGDLRAQTARLQQAESTNRVLRDELLGLGQRAALVEDNLHKLADPERSGMQALRLDEVEILLSQGQQRLQLQGDLAGARRVYAIAAQLLEGIADPAWFNLRQALTQERSALDALGDDPKVVAAGRLEAFAATLPSLPVRDDGPADPASAWWDRAFSRLVDVRPSATAIAVEPADRAAGLAALRLELTLAQSAIERRDQDATRASLGRADGWVARLWPVSPEQQALRRQLRALQALPLTVELPTLGSTLEQLRAQRSAR